MKTTPAKHIVLIVFDYMGYGDIEPFGQSEIRTPNIRALAEGGVRYTDFYGAAPICVPSRAAMLTGRYPRHLGIENNIYHGEPGLSTKVKSLARYFKDAGFATALYGKWHLGYEAADGPNAHGFDDFMGFHEWNIDYYSHKTRDGEPALNRNTELRPRDGYTSDIFTDSAVDFIRQRGADPYFLYVAYNAALPPYRPPGLEDDHASRDTWVNGDRADYAAAIAHLDFCVGRIMAALQEQGIADDTAIMLTYDHGGAELATKGPFFHGFGTLWEGGIRVPMILHWPNGLANGSAPAGAVVSEPGILMDVTPTLLAAAGLTAEQGIDGRDLLSPDPGPGERTLHWRIDLPDLHGNWRARAQRALRRGKWKYLWDGGFEFLHDLETDPGERENLSHRHPDIMAELKALSESDW
jgi:arylsulfatase A-like enzyme